MANKYEKIINNRIKEYETELLKIPIFFYLYGKDRVSNYPTQIPLYVPKQGQEGK